METNFIKAEFKNPLLLNILYDTTDSSELVDLIDTSGNFTILREWNGEPEPPKTADDLLNWITEGFTNGDLKNVSFSKISEKLMSELFNKKLEILHNFSTVSLIAEFTKDNVKTNHNMTMTITKNENSIEAE